VSSWPAGAARTCGPGPHASWRARSHTFTQLATAIDDAFGRWDRAHLHQFWLADDTRVTEPDPDWDDEPVLDDRATKLSRLELQLRKASYAY
jgi:hypothetical protein